MDKDATEGSTNDVVDKQGEIVKDGDTAGNVDDGNAKVDNQVLIRSLESFKEQTAAPSTGRFISPMQFDPAQVPSLLTNSVYGYPYLPQYDTYCWTMMSLASLSRRAALLNEPHRDVTPPQTTHTKTTVGRKIYSQCKNTKPEMKTHRAAAVTPTQLAAKKLRIDEDAGDDAYNDADEPLNLSRKKTQETVAARTDASASPTTEEKHSGIQ